MFFQIRDEGDKKIILKQDTEFKNDKISIEISGELAEEVIKILNDGYEVELQDGKITKINKNKYGISANDPEKYRIVTKLDNYLQSRLKTGSMIDYLRYMDYLSELADEGYFITNKNREEMYLKILETGDDRIIELLEQYLILKDSLSEVKTARLVFTNLLEELLDTQESDILGLKEIEDKIPQ